MAFTHIPLMPAGDVASGVETSRGLETVNTDEKPSLVLLNSLKSRACILSVTSNNIYIAETEEKCRQQSAATSADRFTCLVL